MSDTEARRPKVSVVMITYNHEPFIEQAVRSVMMQETDFDYELVIGEDCSTDRTREIVLRLKEEFPDKIRLLLHPQNVGMIPNFVAVYNACDGEYIALLEGDDYWTDPRKLQIQVDYMEAHPECRLSFHAADVYSVDGTKLKELRPPSDVEVTVNDWLRYRARTGGGYIATGSLVFKQPEIPLPEWYLNLRAMGDWPLIMWLGTLGGALGFVDGKSLSVYRRHSGGISYARSTHQRVEWLKDFELIRPNLPDYWPAICLIAASLCMSLSSDFTKNSDRRQARLYFWKAVRYTQHWRDFRVLRRLFSLFLRCYIPHAHQLYLSVRYGRLAE